MSILNSLMQVPITNEINHMKTSLLRSSALNFFWLCFLTTPAFPCANEYLDGSPRVPDANIGSIFQAYENKKNNRIHAQTVLKERIASNWGFSEDLRKQKDLAVLMIRSGEPANAISILISIEEKIQTNPGHFLSLRDPVQF